MGKPSHVLVRESAVQYMREHRAGFEGFFTEKDSLDDRIRRVSKPGTDGDSYELSAVASHYGRDIVVHSARRGVQPIMTLAGDGSAPPLHLAYWGEGHGRDTPPMAF